MDNTLRTKETLIIEDIFQGIRAVSQKIHNLNKPEKSHWIETPVSRTLHQSKRKKKSEEQLLSTIDAPFQSLLLSMNRLIQPNCDGGKLNYSMIVKTNKLDKRAKQINRGRGDEKL